LPNLELDEITDIELVEPKKCKVFLLNDDYTSMDFVVSVLMEIFKKGYEESVSIMLEVHHKGQGLCGIYTCDIAKTKVHQVHKSAHENGFPLKAIIERI
jgi:ATP-dependent Clp protease adaptor protein ClpS